MFWRPLCCALAFGVAAAGSLITAGPPIAVEPSWTTAHRKPPMSAAETKAFITRLAHYVVEHHLRTDGPMRGMVYEYFDVKRKGQFDQFVQGEALDTMHDGAWLAAALVSAYRATGDPFYKDVLADKILPFYCKVLNHSDTLFSTAKGDARPGAHKFDKEHALQPAEKGFVPYWWDDGGSVSLERRRDKNPLGPFPCTDHFAGKENPKFLLSGYSHGSSNHLAQDLGVMLQQAWLLLRESKDAKDQALAKEVAEAAKNLHECRMRHHGHIPMCDAPAALAWNDAKLMKFVPDQSGPGAWTPGNHYTRALYDFKPGQRQAFPGFADDQQYRYTFGIAKHGGDLPRALAFRTIYDAYTEPMLYRFYSDDAATPAGINRFDLHPYYAKDGRLEDYRSDKKGPFGKARPIGSRMGPQNMICCGLALQALKAFPGIWEERYQRFEKTDRQTFMYDSFPGETRPRAQYTLQQFGNAGLYLESERQRFIVGGATREKELTLRVFAKPDGEGPFAKVTIKPGELTAVNDQGDKLLVDGEARIFKGELRFHVHLPYTVSRGQKAWGNASEHGRLSLQVGNDPHPVNLYIMSAEEHVQRWLEHELAGGLRTWEAIFDELGYIPTGIGAGDWDRFSDSGGYAHLIGAASQWLLYLDGKSDWRVHKLPVVR
jgi:hypothetical protein